MSSSILSKIRADLSHGILKLPKRFHGIMCAVHLFQNDVRTSNKAKVVHTRAPWLYPTRCYLSMAFPLFPPHTDLFCLFCGFRCCCCVLPCCVFAASIWIAVAVVVVVVVAVATVFFVCYCCCCMLPCSSFAASPWIAVVGVVGIGDVDVVAVLAVVIVSSNTYYYF